MARVQEAFLQTYPSLVKSQLRQPVIFVVDMINGFLHEGALHDPNIHDITPDIIKLLELLECRSIFVADAHPPKTREFLSYPSHCVIGTNESEVIQELQPYIHECMHKNSTNTFTAQDFQSFAKDQLHQYQDIIITGCCTDICILQFALCLNAWLNEHNEEEQRLIIPINCIDTYHIDGVHDAVTSNEFSISNMAMNGICMVSEISEG